MDVGFLSVAIATYSGKNGDTRVNPMHTLSRTEIESRSSCCGDELPAHASISIMGKQLDLLLLFGGTQHIKQLCTMCEEQISLR
jgi:hypothetical protein